jgi:vitamin K-dependent gamma-carboxylase
VTPGERLSRWLEASQPVLRLELVRILAPLAILGFMSSRIAHADEWLGDGGFRVPDLGASDYRQPLYLPALPSWAAWAVAAAMVASGLAVAAGYRARRAALVFAAVAAFVALSDRLAAFSVSKMAPMIAIALAASPCGRRLSIDAYLARRRDPRAKLPREVRSGAVRFFQVLLPVIYSASGIAKARGDWLSHPHVLWTHLHDSYQTAVTVVVANTLPAGAWTLLQYVVLTFEAGAPLWFAWSRTRLAALVVGVGMHTMIGLMFGPVRYFAMLMATLLLASFLPSAWLDRIARRCRRI